MKRKLCLLIFLCLSALSIRAFAWNILTDDIDVDCQQKTKVLECVYRSVSTEPILSIEAKSNNESLEITNNTQHPGSNDVTAILFLVDTSDPGRKNVIEKNKTHIKELLNSLKTHHKIGLASFDKSLDIKAPLGTSRFLLSKSIDSLKATGKTTELYRNLLKAIEHVKSFDAQRKAIILLSDGQAEDKAYFHSDVIKSARESRIVINSIGYPRSIALSVALQTTRRLSEETGGSYFETDMTYNIPSSYLNNPYSNFDNGGSFSIRLDDLYQQETPPKNIKLIFKNKITTKSINAPVSIKVEKKVIPERVKTAAIDKTETARQINPTTSAPVQIITKQVEPQTINLWLWYGLPAAFIIIIIFILITLFLLWNRQPSTKEKSVYSEYKPYAYLISNDENETRYPITRTIWRIGRSKDNELSLSDTSLSRRHAEIHRNNNGTFDIIDMNSMNGVYVNNEKVGKTELHEGDIVEIGDVFLRFTQLASDYSLEESTVMQKTKMPTTH